MTKDQALTVYLLAMFGLSGASITLRFAATAKLASWLYRNKREVWHSLGCPGTTFFKGDGRNGYLSRTSALQILDRMMPLRNNYALSGDEVESYYRQHRLGSRLATFFIVLFIGGVFFGVAFVPSRTGNPANTPKANQGKAMPSDGHKPSNFRSPAGSTAPADAP